MLETAANDHNPGVTSDQGPKDEVPLHEIVIVGGGPAGLELATGLGNTLARRRRARITLVDKARAHTLRLSRLRLTCFARSEHRRKSDGISRQEEFLHRRLLRAFDVSFTVQDARGCPARTREHDPRYVAEPIADAMRPW